MSDTKIFHSYNSTDVDIYNNLIVKEENGYKYVGIEILTELLYKYAKAKKWYECSVLVEMIAEAIDAPMKEITIKLKRYN